MEELFRKNLPYSIIIISKNALFLEFDVHKAVFVLVAFIELPDAVCGFDDLIPDLDEKTLLLVHLWQFVSNVFHQHEY